MVKKETKDEPTNPPEKAPEPAPADAPKAATTESDKKKEIHVRSFMTRADEKPVKKLSEEHIYPKAVEIAPKSPFQFILFELPVFFHLPLFFLFNLSLDQTLLVLENVAICFVLSLISIDLMNRARSAQGSQRVYIILIVLFIAVNIYFVYRAVLWWELWDIKQFPVFGRIFG